MELAKKVKGKVSDKLLEKVFDMIENIDIIDQLAEMVKMSVPLKAEFTVKGNKKLEVNVHGIKDGQLWISVKKIRKEKPAEKPEIVETEEPTEAVVSES